jgi:hypothetical protein
VSVEREIGYTTLVTESLRTATRHRSLWILGAFVLYLQGGLGFIFQDDTRRLVMDADLSKVALFGLFIPGALAVLGVVHALADGGLIAASTAFATGGDMTLGAAWRRGRATTGSLLASWLLLATAFVGWAGFTSGIPVLLGILVHPLVGLGFGFLGLGVFLVTILFILPVGMFAQRAIVVDAMGLARAWQMGLTMVRRDPARAAGITITGTLYGLTLWLGELLAVMLGAAVWVTTHAALPVPIAVGTSVFLLLPVYLGVRGCLGSALSFYWTLAYLWVRRDLLEEAASG